MTKFYKDYATDGNSISIESLVELMKLEHYRWTRQQISDGYMLNNDKKKEIKYHTDLRNLFELESTKRMYDLINISCSNNIIKRKNEEMNKNGRKN
jgi:hypothetical protein